MVVRFLERVYRKVLVRWLIVTRKIFSEKNSRSGKAFIVYGPESSGTRMLTRFLIGCGCFGDGQHKQLLDFENPDRDVKLVAWRRSIPHLYVRRPLVLQMGDLMHYLGYDVTLVAITRDPESTVRSQVKRTHVDSLDKARKNREKAIKFMQMIKKKSPFPIVEVKYESFVRDREYRRILAERLGAPYRETEVYTNKNQG